MISKRFSLLFILAAMVVLGSLTVQAQDKIQVTWYVGLGTGTNSEQIATQEQVVADFNASQDEVELVLNVAGSNETARDALATLIASGNSPDIIGPVGVGGSHAFADQWLDLGPLVESSGFDLSIFDPALVDLYRTADGQLLGIPFAVFPSVLYYNRNLFDEAGVAYPPSEFGATYVYPDGTEAAWSYENLPMLGKFMTVDANGNDATMAEFDPNNIVQFGFTFQWSRIRTTMTHIQPEVVYNPEDNTVVVPESWNTALSWFQDAIWVDHFIPNSAYEGSEILAPSAFSSGSVAMAVTPLWYTCCLDNSVGNFDWDFAVVPASLDGEQHVTTDADTFRLTKGSENPEAAFTALTYMLTEAAGTLSVAYGAFPALPDAQETYLNGLSERYGMDLNFDVITASLSYNNPGDQHHEAYVPNWQKFTDRHDAIYSLILGETGADVDVAAEHATLAEDWNTIINE